LKNEQIKDPIGFLANGLLLTFLPLFVVIEMHDILKSISSGYFYRLFLLVLFTSVLIAPVSAETIVSISPFDQSIAPGSNVTVTVYIEPDTPISGAQLDLSFDSELLSVVSVSEGDVFTNGASTLFNGGTIDNSEGTIKNVYNVLFGKNEVTESGTLATIVFETKALGASSLQLSNVVVSNSSGAAVPISVVNGMISMLVPAASADNPYAEEEQQMLDLINQEREENGLDPLRFNSLLNDVTSDHSQEMIEKDYFNHNSYNGTSFFTRIMNSGYESYTCAENIAFRVPPSVTVAHEGLMNSPGHRANILNPSYNEIGIGIWVGEYKYNGRTYSNAAMYTQNFGWGEPATDPVVTYNPYDENEDYVIDIGEVSAAIDDYRTQGPTSIAELSELIDMYRSGEPYC
jgi:uncharacterized protein YkwD